METKCQSCGMPIESGPYCRHCADDSGNLQAFDERLARMIQWTRRENPGLDEATVERKTLQYMAKMPAWKDHPALRERLGG